MNETAASDDKVLWEETVPGGAHWSGVLRRGVSLRITDLHGGANVAILFFNNDEKLERYNMADTLKAQHTAHLTRGFVCYSDMGRVLCSITDDSVGWHDPIGGLTDAALIRAKYGDARFQEQRNLMHRNGRDSLLIEMGKHGLGRRDLAANINLFSKVTVDDAGDMIFVPGNAKAGDHIDLRFEMNTLAVLATTPHPLDPNSEYAPKPVRLTAIETGPAPAEDYCRSFRPENGRGLHNTERLFR